MFSTPSQAYDEDIPFYDADGYPVAYISTTNDNTIYLWEGEPVAYLYSRGNNLHIYGFNGNHLGWLDDGIIEDHRGNAVGFVKGATNVITAMPSIKGLKSLRPLKSLKSLPPLKPTFTKKWGNTPLALFLAGGID